MMMALRESNSLKPIMQCKKAIKRQQCAGIGKVAPQARTIPTIPTCEDVAETVVLF